MKRENMYVNQAKLARAFLLDQIIILYSGMSYKISEIESR
jgi:hypothetical protein